MYYYGWLSGGKPRELHIEKSIDVITVPAKAAEDCVRPAADLPVNQKNVLYRCDCYTAYQLTVRGELRFEQSDPFLFLSVTEGVGTVDGHPVKKGDHMILPCGYGNVCVQGNLSGIAATVGCA